MLFPPDLGLPRLLYPRDLLHQLRSPDFECLLEHAGFIRNMVTWLSTAGSHACCWKTSSSAGGSSCPTCWSCSSSGSSSRSCSSSCSSFLFWKKFAVHLSSSYGISFLTEIFWGTLAPLCPFFLDPSLPPSTVFVS